MWPWEHAIVAYLAYSLCRHILTRESPGGLDGFAVVVASVLPDLIDKPLAWEYGVFDVGYGIGHSIFFAVPLALVVGTVANAAGRPRTGLAFGFGYLSHLPADVADALFRQGVLQVELMLWPAATVEGRPPGPGVVEAFTMLFDRYWHHLIAGELSTYRWTQVGLAGLALLVWLADGAPVLRECLVAGTRGVRALLARDAESSRANRSD
ncbi:metal-dependent hydrolase [Natrinema salifodinae]|uniref:LexA-binding, inner membrane-associated putative hydrolase n=1 Tax=Natrinema salifodinae TaxID=1202768 RepID=A0A1I0QX84_9EURY|nr:metal-dependent hydrolase [Natrinema salifodinae]SEW32130.1 LexA-binding, inner membrane-associated putative hydrolase [Natrinema salifodinae]